MQGLTFKAFKDKKMISIKDVMLKLRKTLGTFKDYDSGFYKILSKAFITYRSIMVSLFETTVFRFQVAFILFYGPVL